MQFFILIFFFVHSSILRVRLDRARIRVRIEKFGLVNENRAKIVIFGLM